MPQDAIVLLPVQGGGLKEVTVPEARVTFVGRGKTSGISDASVSRQHCELFWSRDPVLNATPRKKRCIIERDDSDAVVQVGETGKVRSHVLVKRSKEAQSRQKHHPAAQHEIVFSGRWHARSLACCQCVGQSA